jgi:glycosyltransferase involved in cell wall biosynthesis
MHPRVSVVIPTFNRAAMLREAIDSVLGQSYRNLEIIVVDHGSTDDTVGVLTGYRDSPLTCIPVDRGQNLSHVRNRGILAARGELIAFLDSDDLWEPEKLQQQVELLEAYPDVGFVQCGFHVVDERGIRGTDLQQSDGMDSGSEFYVGNIFSSIIRARLPLYTSTILMRRNAIDAAGALNEDLRAGECEFVARLAFHCRAGLIHKPLARIRKHTGNSSKSHWEQDFQEALYTIENFARLGHISRDVFEEMSYLYHRNYGQCLFRRGHPARARAEFMACLRLRPVSPKLWWLYVRTRASATPSPSSSNPRL